MSDLNAIEQAALLPLAVRYHHRPLDDRDTAAVAELRWDGAAVLVKLTVDRLPGYAFDYWERRSSESFSFPADD